MFTFIPARSNITLFLPLALGAAAHGCCPSWNIRFQSFVVSSSLTNAQIVIRRLGYLLLIIINIDLQLLIDQKSLTSCIQKRYNNT